MRSCPSPSRTHPAALIFATLAVTLLLALLWPLHAKVQEGEDQMKAVNNCRQIVISLRLYASDHMGAYPDVPPMGTPKPSTANEAFRELFRFGDCTDEMIFGCPVSPFKPDGNIGKGPDFNEALKKGENHWAMTAGMDDTMAGALPLVYENPADTKAPPHWDTSVAGLPKLGRVWEDGRIVVGFNNGAVQFMPVDIDPGTSLGELKPFGADDWVPTGKPIFFGANEDAGRTLKILPVEP